MKRRGWKRGMAPLLMAALLLGGCGNSNNTESAMAPAVNGRGYTVVAQEQDMAYATDDIYDTGASYEEMEYEETGGSSPAQAENVQDTSRKLIRTISMDVETREFESLLASVRNRTKALDGYVESSNEYNGSSYYSGQLRYASLTLRIPAERVDGFVDEIAELSNITRQSEDVTDVTLSYVDLESHRNVLRAEQERLTELLGEAETVEEMIFIESRLSDIRYQIESMESQLRTYDNKVDYATVYVNVSEVEELTPIEPEQEPSVWERISTGFMRSLRDVGRGLRSFFIGLIVALPYLVVWGVALLIVILILRAIVRGMKKRALKRQERRAARNAEGAAKGAASAGSEAAETVKDAASVGSEAEETAKGAVSVEGETAESTAAVGGERKK